MATNATPNVEKDPDDWVTGDEPMTASQASYLQTLAEQTHRDAPISDTLTKAEASKLIDDMRETLAKKSKSFAAAIE